MVLAAGCLLPLAAVTAAADSPSPAPQPAAMVYADPGLAPGGSLGSGKARERAAGINLIAAELEQGLDEYRLRWGALPAIQVPAGPTLRRGASGPRVQALRERLGLYDDGSFDAELEQALADYRAAHGLGAGGVADAATIRSLNRGPDYYERLIARNIDRARALPADLGRRFILVDTAAARLWMYEDGRPVDSMRVIVGRPASQTPMMAAYVRYAVLNPYWNVPPDLVRERIAPNVLSQGLPYLQARGYELLSGYGDDAQPVEPETVDWAAVAAGQQELVVRQRPGAGNMMGAVKYVLPNELGIYLHDTPERQLFQGADRRQSSGCIRLEDAPRLGTWLFGHRLTTASNDPEQRVDLPEPVPVYITYFTAAPDEGRIVFRDDVYGRDRDALAASGL
jgi:murein L,D-transpeptidase YcbB/YkuD